MDHLRELPSPGDKYQKYLRWCQDIIFSDDKVFLRIVAMASQLPRRWSDLWVPDNPVEITPFSELSNKAQELSEQAMELRENQELNETSEGEDEAEPERLFYRLSDRVQKVLLEHLCH